MNDERFAWLRLTLLGLLSGLLAGLVVVAFQAGVEVGQRLLLPFTAIALVKLTRLRSA